VVSSSENALLAHFSPPPITSSGGGGVVCGAVKRRAIVERVARFLRGGDEPPPPPLPPPLPLAVVVGCGWGWGAEASEKGCKEIGGATEGGREGVDEAKAERPRVKAQPRRTHTRGRGDVWHGQRVCMHQGFPCVVVKNTHIRVCRAALPEET